MPPHSRRISESSLEPASEFSYGIIPICCVDLEPGGDLPQKITTATTKVLLVHQKSPMPTATPYYHWSFPKGHAEPEDRSPRATALRELLEETGLTLRDGEAGLLFQDKSGEGLDGLSWRSRNPFKGWIKEVRFWIGVVDVHDEDNREPKAQEQEIAEVRWCSWDEARELCTTERAKTILQKVIELLDRQ